MRLVVLALTLAALTACSESGEQSAGHEDARRSCSLLNRAWDRAAARADELNESGEDLAHPAHVGDDGYQAVEWEMFERADRLAQGAATADRHFSGLSAALSDLVQAKGSGGVAAVFTLNEPTGAAFNECYDLGLLTRPR